ncbi:hypothetical protein TJA_23770 [Thermus sp. LT1-2-5]|uniref:RCC1 domain-containing protein n=1 Tax=Thermus sp. LT1-2-5 TaxID=3026935 RepID=UPI0030E9CB36
MQKTLVLLGLGLALLLAACGGQGGGNGNGGSIDPSRFQAILAAGTDFVLLVKPEGVYAWGDNRFGQLGVDPGVLDHRPEPERVEGTEDAVAVAAQFGIGENQRHALALMADGRVKSWGVNPYGQLGRAQGYPTLDYQPPDYVVAEGGSEYLASVRALDAGHDFTVVLHTDHGRRVLGFGDNLTGVLTQGQDWYYDPRPFLGPDAEPLTNVRQVDAGNGHTLLLLEDGTVWSTGSNLYGQRGLPRVSDSYAHPVPGLTGVSQVSAGRDHSLVLKEDGTVWAFGGNAEGQLGQDPAEVPSTHEPQRVPFPVGTRIRSVAAGGTHNLAIDEGGQVWAWGSDDHGQLGQGQPGGFSAIPVRVKGPGCNGVLGNALVVKAGYDYSLAIVQEGSRLALYAWGLNDRGQLGKGDTLDASCPVRVLTWAP